MTDSSTNVTIRLKTSEDAVKALELVRELKKQIADADSARNLASDDLEYMQEIVDRIILNKEQCDANTAIYITIKSSAKFNRDVAENNRLKAAAALEKAIAIADTADAKHQEAIQACEQASDAFDTADAKVSGAQHDYSVQMTLLSDATDECDKQTEKLACMSKTYDDLIKALADAESKQVAATALATSSMTEYLMWRRSNSWMLDPESKLELKPTLEPEPASTLEPASTSTLEPASTSTLEPASTSTLEPASTSTLEPESTSSFPDHSDILIAPAEVLFEFIGTSKSTEHNWVRIDMSRRPDSMSMREYLDNYRLLGNEITKMELRCDCECRPGQVDTHAIHHYPRNRIISVLRNIGSSRPDHWYFRELVQ